jgi:hypothetical protein
LNYQEGYTDRKDGLDGKNKRHPGGIHAPLKPHPGFKGKFGGHIEKYQETGEKEDYVEYTVDHSLGFF